MIKFNTIITSYQSQNTVSMLSVILIESVEFVENETPNDEYESNCISSLFLAILSNITAKLRKTELGKPKK